MPRVRFLPANYELDVPVGARIVDVTDEHPEARVPYSCRSASCGTCRSEVVEGMDGIQTPAAEELSVLEIFGDGPELRLCCQMKSVKDVPKITLRVIEP